MMNEIKVEQQLVFNDRPADYVIETRHNVNPDIVTEYFNNCLVKAKNVKTGEIIASRQLKEKEIKSCREERLNALKKHELALKASQQFSREMRDSTLSTPSIDIK